ncbi:MAG: thiol-disulfide oxidoreductase DCC family protein [Pirellulaceae bacterium]|nr:thiol-disulfide oxidoreductase DCC family protein [Pirellulaceae bacterium]
MQTPTPSPEAAEPPCSHVVLFDGVCNLCNGMVNFLIDRDPHKKLKFAALQSGYGARLREVHQLDDSLSSIILVEGDVVYQRSTAVLRIVRQLKGIWPLVAILLIVPRVIRDGVYRFVAKNRYRWFGKREQCRISTPDLQERFLD